MEEFRGIMADRFVLTLINKRIMKPEYFTKKESGAVIMTDQGRKTFLSAWQSKKQETIKHPYLDEKLNGGWHPMSRACYLPVIFVVIWMNILHFLEVGEEIMLVLITYDVNTQSAAGRKRLRQVAKACTNYGQRVQNSVFECQMDATKCTQVRHILEEIIDKEVDSLRFYYLGDKYKNKVEHIGAKQGFDVTDTLIL